MRGVTNDATHTQVLFVYFRAYTPMHCSIAWGNKSLAFRPVAQPVIWRVHDHSICCKLRYAVSDTATIQIRFGCIFLERTIHNLSSACMHQICKQVSLILFGKKGSQNENKNEK
jgi:hypothetical protein